VSPGHLLLSSVLNIYALIHYVTSFSSLTFTLARSLT
jgi:hypothetical protein